MSHLTEYFKDVLAGRSIPLDEVRIAYAEALDTLGRLKTHESLQAEHRRLLDNGIFFLPNAGPERDSGLAFLEKLKEAGYLPHEDKKTRS